MGVVRGSGFEACPERASAHHFQASAPFERRGVRGVYAFENVNVVPMDEERILEEQTVLVVGDRISRIGPASSVAG